MKKAEPNVQLGIAWNSKKIAQDTGVVYSWTRRCSYAGQYADLKALNTRGNSNGDSVIDGTIPCISSTVCARV